MILKSEILILDQLQFLKNSLQNSSKLGSPSPSNNKTEFSDNEGFTVSKNWFLSSTKTPFCLLLLCLQLNHSQKYLSQQFRLRKKISDIQISSFSRSVFEISSTKSFSKILLVHNHEVETKPPLFCQRLTSLNTCSTFCRIVSVIINHPNSIFVLKSDDDDKFLHILINFRHKF